MNNEEYDKFFAPEIKKKNRYIRFILLHAVIEKTNKNTKPT